MKLCRVLTRPGPLYPEGRGHIINILVSVLPGIDCNDIKKTMSVFQLISIYGRLVPMVDLTSFLSSRKNLSPTEKKICQDSAKLRGFVMEFMDKCFILVENSTLELIRQEQSTSDAHMSSEVRSHLYFIIKFSHLSHFRRAPSTQESCLASTAWFSWRMTIFSMPSSPRWRTSSRVVFWSQRSLGG